MPSFLDQKYPRRKLENQEKSPKKVSINLCTYMYKNGRRSKNRSKRGQKQVKKGSKRGQKWVSSGKWLFRGQKGVKKGSKMGQKWSKSQKMGSSFEKRDREIAIWKWGAWVGIRKGGGFGGLKRGHFEVLATKMTSKGRSRSTKKGGLVAGGDHLGGV
jgi:hypothetical protein